MPLDYYGSLVDHGSATPEGIISKFNRLVAHSQGQYDLVVIFLPIPVPLNSIEVLIGNCIVQPGMHPWFL